MIYETALLVLLLLAVCAVIYYVYVDVQAKKASVDGHPALSGIRERLVSLEDRCETALSAARSASSDAENALSRASAARTAVSNDTGKVNRLEERLNKLEPRIEAIQEHGTDDDDGISDLLPLLLANQGQTGNAPQQPVERQTSGQGSSANATGTRQSIRGYPVATRRNTTGVRAGGRERPATSGGDGGRASDGLDERGDGTSDQESKEVDPTGA